MLFIGVERFSPVANGIDLPHKYDLFHFGMQRIPENKEEFIKFVNANNIVTDEDWWEEQWNRCLNGYWVDNAIEEGGDWCVDGVDCFWSNGDCYLPEYDLIIRNKKVFISGRYYFYLNFWKIYGVKPGTKTKGVISPKFLAMDYLFFRRIEMMFEQSKDCQELKSRQLGYSEKVAGGIAGYNFTFVDASITVIVGGQQADADHTMFNTKRGLNYLRNTQFFLERDKGGDSTELLRSKTTLSEVMSLTAKDNDETVSRFSPYWVIYEEIGKGKRGWSIGTANYVKPSIMTEGVKTGWQTFIGTGGNMQEGVADLEDRTYNPKEYNILEFTNKWVKPEETCDIKIGHFTPRWMYHLLDENGNPNKMKSIEDLAIKELQEKIQNRATFRSQQPVYLSDVFTSSIDGYFGREIIELLQRRYNTIRSHKELQIVKKGVLEWIDKNDWRKGVVLKHDDDGWFQFIEKPKLDEQGQKYLNLYSIGIDSYDQDEAHSSDSKGCLRVRKNYLPNEGLYNCTVGMILERPSVAAGGAEKFYEHCIMACVYYGGQANIEYSNLRIFDFFKNNGFEYLLKERPQLAFAGMINNSKQSNKYGTDRALKPQILAIGRNRLDEEYIDRMFFLDEINALKTFRYDPTGKKFNCDITIAWAECEVSAKEDEGYIVMKKSEVEKRQTKGMTVYKTINGRLTKQYI